ncbi:hypothetical protein ACOSQ3_003496 [Xanthoceras sorbifolium]
MKATPSLSSVVFLVLALCLCQSLIADSVFNKFRVHLINGFKNSTLEAHCKSEKGNDLGHQHIPVHQQFSWKFYTGLFVFLSSPIHWLLCLELLVRSDPRWYDLFVVLGFDDPKGRLARGCPCSIKASLNRLV